MKKEKTGRNRKKFKETGNCLAWCQKYVASSQVPKFQSSKVQKFKNSKVQKFPSFQVPNFPSSQIPKFPSSQVSKFPSSQVPKFPSSQVPKFPNFFFFSFSVKKIIIIFVLGGWVSDVCFLTSLSH